MLPKKIAICLTLLVASFGVSGASCPNMSFLENARETFRPLFKNPPDLSAPSRMPFKGRIRDKKCNENTSSCRVVFDVQEIFFDPNVFILEIFGEKEKATTTIAVTIDNIKNADFSTDSEWLVIAEGYASRDGEGSGFIHNHSCGISLAKYSNDNVIVNDGRTNISYQTVRSEILKPITPAGVARLKSAFRDQLKKARQD